MANRKLNSIKFPDIADTYILDADKVNFDDSETYASGSVGKALQNKADIDGSYENLTAGNAEQLVSNVKVNDKTPYIFRTSGGSVDIGDREYVGGIVGGTVAWNQLVSLAKIRETRTIQGVQFTNNNNGTITLSGTATGTANAGEWNVLGLPTDHVCLYTFIDTDSKLKWTMGKYPSNASDQGTIKIVSGNTYNITFYPQSFDLTQMFGSTIADYIYSLETANAGAGVAWFKKLFNKPYYAYNAGELKSVSGLVSHDMTGFNQWDEEWEAGRIDTTTGLNEGANDRIRSKNYIPYIANATYGFSYPSDKSRETGDINILWYDEDFNFISAYGWVLPEFTFPYGASAPSNARYMRFFTNGAYGTTYKNDICINISWDGSRNGEYEPYELHSYPLDTDLTLRGIPKLDANNSLHYDGDVYAPSGEVTRKYGILDLGSVTWTKNTAYSNNPYFAYELSDTINSSQTGVCSKYTLTTFSNLVTDNGNKQFALAASSNKVYVKDTAYTEADAFKTAMSGVYLVYELDTPTTETADAYQQTQIVNDFGTEEYVIDSNTFAVPVGSDTDYPVNLVAKLEMAPNSPEGNGDYIVRQVNGENSYVPLVIEDALPTIPSTVGSYKLTVTVAEGSDPVLSWEAE